MFQKNFCSSSILSSISQLIDIYVKHLLMDCSQSLLLFLIFQNVAKSIKTKGIELSITFSFNK